MAGDVEVFTVDAAKIRKGAVAIGVAAFALSLLVAYQIMVDLPVDRSVRLALAIAVPVLAVVGSILVGLRSTRQHVRLTVDPAGLTVDYFGHHTELAWSDIEDVATTRPGEQGYLLITAGPGVELAGRWRQQWWYRSYSYGFSGGRTPFPRWSPTRKGQVEVVSLTWFDPPARAAILAAARRHVG